MPQYDFTTERAIASRENSSTRHACVSQVERRSRRRRPRSRQALLDGPPGRRGARTCGSAAWNAGRSRRRRPGGSTSPSERAARHGGAEARRGSREDGAASPTGSAARSEVNPVGRPEQLLLGAHAQEQDRQAAAVARDRELVKGQISSSGFGDRRRSRPDSRPRRDVTRPDMASLGGWRCSPVMVGRDCVDADVPSRILAPEQCRSCSDVITSRRWRCRSLRASGADVNPARAAVRGARSVLLDEKLRSSSPRSSRSSPER